MAVLSTTPDVDFAVPAAGTFSVSCTAPVRLMRRIGAGNYVSAGDVPPHGHGPGHFVGDNAVAGLTYQVRLLHPSATFSVDQ